MATEPVTAPDMVSVMTEVLVAHAATWQHRGEWLECECGETWPGAFDETAAIAAHQARAVLAAISEAGAVEWGVRTTLGMHVPYDTEDDARAIAAQHGSAVVTRLVFDWERAE